MHKNGKTLYHHYALLFNIINIVIPSQLTTKRKFIPSIDYKPPDICLADDTILSGLHV